MRRKRKRLMEWEAEAVAQAYLDGEKLEAVAAEFGISISGVSRVGERRGYPRRTDGGRPPKGGTKQGKPSFWIMRRALREKRRLNVERRASHTHKR